MYISKNNNSFYFWKDVEIEHLSKIENVSGYGETRIEKRSEEICKGEPY